MGHMRVKVCFFFNDTATTEIYTLSLHDALPIWSGSSTPLSSAHAPTRSSPSCGSTRPRRPRSPPRGSGTPSCGDRKSTRLNSSHANISYAVFCLKKQTLNLLFFLLLLYITTTPP